MNNIGDIGLKLLGYKYGLSPKINNLLKKIGSLPISSVVIVRQPIQGAINTLLNTLTFGDYDKQRKKLNYDYYFHLKLLINGKYIIEKNERINIDFYKKSNGEEYMNINDINNNITINQLLNNTLKLMGNERFYKYDAFKNNCQIFVLHLLKGLGIDISPYFKFVKQDVYELIERNPNLNPIANVITGIGEKANILINGGTLKRNNWIEHVKNYSKNQNMTYKNALKNPKCRSCYIKTNS
jgi:hypothetical protein